MTIDRESASGGEEGVVPWREGEPGEGVVGRGRGGRVPGGGTFAGVGGGGKWGGHEEGVGNLFQRSAKLEKSLIPFIP